MKFFFNQKNNFYLENDTEYGFGDYRKCLSQDVEEKKNYSEYYSQVPRVVWLPQKNQPLSGNYFKYLRIGK